jgi:sRNA-binding carbon storage regulator CsrA
LGVEIVGNLVVTRRPGESVNIFDGGGQSLGTVTIGKVSGEKVRLAFCLPKFLVMRSELCAEINTDQEQQDNGRE